MDSQRLCEKDEWKKVRREGKEGRRGKVLV